MDNATRTAAAPAAPGPFASFVRFVVCGGGVGVLSSFAVTLLALSMPWGLANAVITVASTLLCTELHARFTFGAGRRADRREHWQSAGSAAVAYVVTCAAMLLLHLVQSSPSALTEQLVYLGASGLAGLGRFLVLRLFVFTTGRRDATGRRDDSGLVTAPVREYVVPVGVGVAGTHTSPGGKHTSAVLTARRLCPASAQPHRRLRSRGLSGRTRNALCRLDRRALRFSARTSVRRSVPGSAMSRPGASHGGPGATSPRAAQRSAGQESRTLLSLSA